MGECVPGALDCDGSDANGCEVDARADPRSCGFLAAGRIESASAGGIFADGTHGGAGSAPDEPWEGAGGGAAGGTIYLVAPTVVLGTGQVGARGGPEKAACPGSRNGLGGAGGAGRIRVDCGQLDGVPGAPSTTPATRPPALVRAL